jgi:hypothetical protein
MVYSHSKMPLKLKITVRSRYPDQSSYQTAVLAFDRISISWQLWRPSLFWFRSGYRDFLDIGRPDIGVWLYINLKIDISRRPKHSHSYILTICHLQYHHCSKTVKKMAMLFWEFWLRSIQKSNKHMNQSF